MINKPKFSSGGGFPNQFAPDQEKDSYEYGLRVGQAIESEWFSRDYGEVDTENYALNTLKEDSTQEENNQ